MLYFSLWILSRFFLFVFDFLQLHYDIPRCRFWSFILCGVLWRLRFVIGINVQKFSDIIASNISSAPSFFPIYICYTFCNYTTVTGYSIHFSVFKNLHSVWKRLYWYIFKLTDSWAMTCLLRSPSQAFFICYSVFDLQGFGCFFKFPSLLTLVI